MADSQRTDIAALYLRHVKMVYRLCYSYLRSAAEAEDATQSVFMKLIDSPRTFEDEEHEKAWLVVTASNYCKDVLKSARVKRAAQMPDDVEDPQSGFEVGGMLQAVLELPAIYKDCVYLHYYEGYKTAEIAEMIGVPASTVRNRLRDARQLLKRAWEGEHDGR